MYRRVAAPLYRCSCAPAHFRFVLPASALRAPFGVLCCPCKECSTRRLTCPCNSCSSNRTRATGKLSCEPIEVQLAQLLEYDPAAIAKLDMVKAKEQARVRRERIMYDVESDLLEMPFFVNLEGLHAGSLPGTPEQPSRPNIQARRSKAGITDEVLSAGPEQLETSRQTVPLGTTSRFQGEMSSIQFKSTAGRPTSGGISRTGTLDSDLEDDGSEESTDVGPDSNSRTAWA